MISVLLSLGQRVAVVALEGVLIIAIVALVFGGFCLGSYVFYVLKGRMAFAHRTTP